MMHISEAVSYINSVTSNYNPTVGIILGTGLGGFVDNIDIAYSIPYSDIPNMPVSTVEGHAGRLIFGTIGAVKV
ncbi:MAG: purine-nucleoside phosphorylase, partial [Alistipes sp.]|nr:purine-nucleoside phosphorylase [Alistipes sp.]